MATLKTLLPYNHSIAIVSPCNGASVVSYAGIIKVDGLNTMLSDITINERVGMDGAVYLSNKPQYKNLTFTIDLKDDRILWDDFYSFFNKDSIYKIVMDDIYYINGAISKIDYPLFSNREQTATIVFECDAPYWSADRSVTVGPLTMNYIYNQNITIPAGYYEGQLFKPKLVLTFGAMQENMLTGFSLIPVTGNISSNGGQLNLTWLNIFTPAAGAVVTLEPCTNGKIKFEFNSRTYEVANTALPDKTARLVWGGQYVVALKQTIGMTATTLTINFSGTGRYCN